MSDYEKLRDVARRLQGCASILNEIAHGKERRHPVPQQTDDDRMDKVREKYGDYVPSAFKIRELTGCRQNVAKRVRTKLLDRYKPQEPALFEAVPPKRTAPYVSFDERPEVKATVAGLTQTLASAIGTIAQSLVDEDRERGVRLGRTSN